MRYGVRWDEIHSYKDYMAFPDIPKAMPASVLLDKDFSFCEGLYAIRLRRDFVLLGFFTNKWRREK